VRGRDWSALNVWVSRPPSTYSKALPLSRASWPFAARASCSAPRPHLAERTPIRSLSRARLAGAAASPTTAFPPPSYCRSRAQSAFSSAARLLPRRTSAPTMTTSRSTANIMPRTNACRPQSRAMRLSCARRLGARRPALSRSRGVARRMTS
jgi:hypothetical protein